MSSAIQIGGRGQWRIERVMLEEFIAEAYRRAAERAAGAGVDGRGRFRANR